jgi:hypothetical protein
MKNTKKQKRPAAEEEAGGNKSSHAEKDFNRVKKERDYRRKPPKERGKTTLNASKTSWKKATSELAHNRYQTTAALYKSSKTKQQQQGEVETDGTRKDQTGPDPTGPDKRHTWRNTQMSTRFFFFSFFGISLFSKWLNNVFFKTFQVAIFLQIFNLKIAKFLYSVLSCSQKCEVIFF